MTIRVAPVRAASASRRSLTSETVTSVAPNASAHCIASCPIGPAPVTSTRSPALTPAFWHAHTPTESGSISAPSSSDSVVRQREREVLVDRHELRERAVDRRRREEDDVRAEVVAAGAALAAAPARDARLERDAVADGVLGRALAELRPTRPADSWPSTSGASTTNGPIRPCS